MEFAQLLLCLDAFGNADRTQRMGERNQPANNLPAMGLHDIARETPIELEFGDRCVEQPLEPVLAGAEIIERQAKSGQTQPGERFQGASAQAGGRSLGQFEHEPFRGKTMTANGRDEPTDQGIVIQQAARKIYRDTCGKGIAFPGSDISGHLVDDHVGEQADLSRCFSQGNETLGRNVSKQWGPPAGEHLDAGQFARDERNLRLIDDTDLVPRERLAQIVRRHELIGPGNNFNPRQLCLPENFGQASEIGFAKAAATR